MRLLLRSLACVILAAAAYGETEARANITGITITTAAIHRVTSDGSTTYSCPGRGANTNSGCVVYGQFQGIGHKDCLDDTEIQISAQVIGLPDTQNHIEIWAGPGDCTAAGATHNNSTGTCWPVAANPTMSTPLVANIRVADIVGQIGINPPSQVYQVSDPTVACNNQGANSAVTSTDDAGVTSTTVGESTINIFFLVYPNGQSTPSLGAPAYPVKVKLIGPAAVSNVNAGPGDGAIIVTWNPPVGDPSIIGYNLYAAPAGSTSSEGGTQLVCSDAAQGTELLDDAGNVVFDDAGQPIFVDDAGNPITQDAGCYTQIIPPGTATCSGSGSFDVSNITCVASGSADASTNSGGAICEQINGTTNAKGTITGLSNGTAYDVEVAAFDTYGNAGTVSGAVCATPQPVNDFWTLYNQSGGNAFCALQVVGNRGGGIAAALVGIAGMIFVRRRKKR